MLDINIEFSRGVLFVRLSGTISKENVKNIEDNIVSILQKSGIRYLVFNLADLYFLESTNLFDKCNRAVENNNGKMIICGNDNLNYIRAKNELSALRMINV